MSLLQNSNKSALVESLIDENIFLQNFLAWCSVPAFITLIFAYPLPF